ncbi:MAG: hypothetical protein JWM57_3203 [Phycisphaerales bacterium]|nr:hypothetical protein [Phycisphaerales bacterium]
MQRLARSTLAAFVLTFVLSRVFVLLIMTRRMPDLFLFVGQTHVHHLNYGIFLLVLVGGWGVFSPPESNRAKHWAAFLYGVGLALTFDEFGMWLHLGGSYWQRASYDAVVVIGALLALLAVAPSIGRWRGRQWAVAAAIAVVCFIGLKLMGDQLAIWTPIFQRLENLGPKV